VPGKTFYIETFGCQMNVHDSEKVSGTLVARGYRQVNRPEEAELVLYNTCSIRDKAEQKVFSRLSNFSNGRSAGKILGVLGCAAQHNGEQVFEQAPQVSLVCGSASYHRLPELISRLEAGETRVTGLDLDTNETFDTPQAERGHPYKAFLTIIEGCDKNCTYCVVPFTRGPERSRPSHSVLEEARRLAAEGYTEIQLLGQTVNSYKDPSPAGLSFAQLLDAVGRIEGVRRVRYTTSHPRDFTPDIVEAMDANPALCDLIHLPVQSGSTRVLRAMERTYTREKYLERIAMIRGASRDIALSTDIIVGFPGETEQDFEQTLSLLDAAEYDQVFSFKYSPRKGTPAAEFAEAVDPETQSRRLAALQEKQREIQARRNLKFLGREEEVLVEGYRERHRQWIGRTTQNRVVNFTGRDDQSGGDSLNGAYCRVRITSAGPNSLVGELTAVEQRPALRALRVLQ